MNPSGHRWPALSGGDPSGTRPAFHHRLGKGTWPAAALAQGNWARQSKAGSFTETLNACVWDFVQEQKGDRQGRRKWFCLLTYWRSLVPMSLEVVFHPGDFFLLPKKFRIRGFSGATEKCQVSLRRFHLECLWRVGVGNRKRWVVAF